MKKPFSGLTTRHLYYILIGLLSAIFLMCVGLLADYYIQSAKQQAQYDELSSIVQQAQQAQQNQQNQQNPNQNDSNSGNTQSSGNSEGAVQTPVPVYTTVVNPKTQQEMEVLTEYAPIYNLNPDVVGWIQIDGTKINYPVMQTPEWVNYYLTRDFNGNNAKHGAIYVNETASITTPSDNVTIYGHKMKDGTMFAALHDYKKKSFFEEHPYITFDTIFEHHQYQILAVFITTANLPDSFNYHLFVDGDENAFLEYVATCKELALYDTGVDAVYGDKLITLSTCEHTIDDGRLVVVAKRIS